VGLSVPAYAIDDQGRHQADRRHRRSRLRGGTGNDSPRTRAATTSLARVSSRLRRESGRSSDRGRRCGTSASTIRNASVRPASDVLSTRLQNLCGVAAPRSVGSTPAPLRHADLGSRPGLAARRVGPSARRAMPPETARSRVALWRTVARMWHSRGCRVRSSAGRQARARSDIQEFSTPRVPGLGPPGVTSSYPRIR